MRRANRRLERGLKDITAEAVLKGAEIKELRRRLTVVKAALDEATEEASKAEAEAGATKEKLVEEKMKTKVFRESNTDLKRSASLSGRTLSSSSRRSSRRRASRRP